jgi:hypothetical protein
MFNADDEQAVIAETARICQVLVGSLMAGVIVFLTITTIISTGDGGAKNPVAGAAAGKNQPLLTYLAAGFSGSAVVLSFILPGLMVAQSRKRLAQENEAGLADARTGVPDTSVRALNEFSNLAMLYRTQLIVGSALAEGAAFFAIIAYLLEQQPIALAMALVALGAIAVRFPTPGRISDWIERQREQVLIDRQAGV